MQPMILVVVASAFALDGALVRRGQTIELPEDLAKDLLRRGKVTVADEAPKAPGLPPKPADEAPKAPAAPTADDALDVGKMNRAALAQKAQELGVAVEETDTKAQIKAKLTEALKAKG